MKKILSVALALMLVVAMFAGLCTASAATYAKKFDDAVGSLFNSMVYCQGIYGYPDGEIKFRADSMIDYTFRSFDREDYLAEITEEYYEYGTEGTDEYYKEGYYVYHYVFAEDEFITRAKNFFNISGEELKLTGYEFKPQWECNYDAAKAEFEITYSEFGGYGGAGFYQFHGYKAEGNNYVVYGHYATYDEVSTTPPASGGYVAIEEDGVVNYFPTAATIKTTVSYNGKYVKFLKWEHIPFASLPAQDTLIFKDEVVAPPTSSTPATSEPTSSETTSDETSSDEPSVTLPVVAEKDGLTIKAENTVFPEGAVVEIKPIAKEESADAYAVVENALKDTAAKFVAYDITAKKDNVKIQPNGKVLAYFDIPQGYDTAKIAVFYVSDDGKFEQIKSTVNTAEGFVVAELDHFSTYVVAEKKVADTPANTTPDNNGSNDGDDADGPNVVLIIVIVVLVLMAAAAAGLIAYLVISKKKK